jgi:DNA (cytosine-5)-methyltransferase 1
MSSWRDGKTSKLKTFEKRSPTFLGGSDKYRIDVICGGFPCQDISVAGKGEGIAGSRSGLWKEFARIIGEIRPRYVIVENVAALLGRGLGDVLGDLAEIGFDAEWHCIPASAVSAPHRRDRIWIVAYPRRIDREWRSSKCRGSQETGSRDWPARSSQHPDHVANNNSQSLFGAAITWPECNPWFIEPDVGRVAHGVPNRVDRLKALGNAIVPQIAEIIGKAIMSHDQSLS